MVGCQGRSKINGEDGEPGKDEGENGSGGGQRQRGDGVGSDGKLTKRGGSRWYVREPLMGRMIGR